MPWIRRRVLVTKERHPLKGKRGVVLNVLPCQPTPSGLKIKVEIIDYNPNAPYPRVAFDYDDLKDIEYVLINVSASRSNELIPDIIPSYTPQQFPPSSNRIIVLDLFSANPWCKMLRIHTCPRPCIR
jgi:hypothetical protein